MVRSVHTRSELRITRSPFRRCSPRRCSGTPVLSFRAALFTALDRPSLPGQRRPSNQNSLRANTPVSSNGWHVRACRLVLYTLMIGLAAEASAAADPRPWWRAESSHLIVISNANEATVRNFVRTLERFHTLLEAVTPGVSPSARTQVAPKLTIYVLRDRASFAAAVPSAPNDLTGLYAADADGTFAVAIAPTPRVHLRAPPLPHRRPSSEWPDSDLDSEFDGPGRQIRIDGEDFVLHEYTHHFMAQYARDVYPAWFSEGIAEYFATAELEGDQPTIGAAAILRARTLTYVPWMDFDELLTVHPAAIGMRKRAVYYAQSWLLVHYLMADPTRFRSFTEYLQQPRTDETPTVRLTKQLGLAPGSLRSTLGRYLGSVRRGKALAVSLPEPALTLTPLPGHADASIPRALRIRLGDRDPALLAINRAQANEQNADRTTLLHAVEAELSFGDPARARALLDRITDEAAANATPSTEPTLETSYFRGMTELALAARAYAARRPNMDVEAHLARARALFDWVLERDPQHSPSLFRLWQAATFRGGPPSPQALQQIARAYQLTPQAQEIALHHGVALLAREQVSEARAVLTAIAEHPHPGRLGAMARALLTRLATPGSRLPTIAEIQTTIDAVVQEPARRSSAAPATSPAAELRDSPATPPETPVAP